jgi:hypothetical protein
VKKELYEEVDEAAVKVLLAEAELKILLIKQGNKLARKEGYQNLRGMNAITRYLADKHHWLPEAIHRLTYAELELLLDGYNFE